MRRRISSRLTVLARWILPLYITGLAVGTFGAIIYDWQRGKPPHRFEIVFLLLVSCTAVFTFWSGYRLKHVFLDRTTLIITHFTQEVHVPVTDLVLVREKAMTRLPIHYVTMTFAQETSFGDTVTFIPTLSWEFYHPIVEELKALSPRAQIPEAYKPIHFPRPYL